MRLYLINPRNPLVSFSGRNMRRWNRYRVWKPLGLLAVAALTPPEWEVAILDENVHALDYDVLPRPDLVGVTAFTAQAKRAYEIAAFFRGHGVPVVMGGIHATMRPEEAITRVGAVVTGEAEPVWAEVLSDFCKDALRPVYAGGYADMAALPSPRHDLLTGDYVFGAIQTTRGCPLNCSFCSVTALNGRRYRQRPIGDVIRELELIQERYLLFVDDNLIGTNRDHLARAKELFRAMIRAHIRKRWIAQVTLNMADDDELLALAARAGCVGVFIGFESPTAEGLRELGKKFNLLHGRDFAASVRRIHRHRILVAGSFILGLDSDQPGIGRRIAETAMHYGVDVLNTLFLTPLPGTRLWDQLESSGRIVAGPMPADWKYYTLTFPVARYQNFTATQLASEMEDCDATFYAIPRILGRVCRSAWHGNNPLIALLANLSFRSNLGFGRRACREFLSLRKDREAARLRGPAPLHTAPKLPSYSA